MTTIQKKRIKKLIPSLFDSVKIPFIPKDNEDSIQGSYVQRQYEMYKACLEYDHVTSDFEYLTFFIKNDVLLTKGFSCASNRNEFVIDDLGDVELSINLKYIEKFLTPYGGKLLFGLKK